MKKTILFLLTLILTLSLISCGGKNKVPSDKQIVEDMNNSEIAQIYTDGETKKVEISKLEIEKAKEEDKSYTVYCNATQNDGNYEYNGQYVLNYNFYERGGWLLDNYEIESYNIKPLIAVPKEEIENFMFTYGYADYEIHSIDEFNKEGFYNTKVTATTYSEYVTEVHEMTLSSYFDGNMWNTSVAEDYVANDWSPIVGKWFGYAQNNRSLEDDTRYYASFNITSVDPNSEMITFDFEFTSPTYLFSDEGRKFSGTGSGVPVSTIGESEYDYEYKIEFTTEGTEEIGQLYLDKNLGLMVIPRAEIKHILQKQ